METDTVTQVTELESPVDPRIRRGLEIKLKKEYIWRLINPVEPWGGTGSCIENYLAHTKFQDAYDKYFIVVTLIHKIRPGETVLVSSILEELREIFGEVNVETFDNAINTIYMYITGQLPLPGY